jgi:hypothetical protein
MAAFRSCTTVCLGVRSSFSSRGMHKSLSMAVSAMPERMTQPCIR